MNRTTMRCQRCGIEGEIEVQGLNSDKSPALIFRHIGHNPLSGHLHYQCPVCEIVMLVDPMTILDGLRLDHSNIAARECRKDQRELLSHCALFLRKVFHDQQAGPC